MDLTIVDYKTFIQQIEQGGVSEVTFYRYSGEVDTVYQRDGTIYGTRSPFVLGDDYLLQSTLEAQNINYTILQEELEGYPQASQAFDSLMPFYFTVLPLILTLVIIVQALSIKSLSTKQSKSDNID